MECCSLLLCPTVNRTSSSVQKSNEKRNWQPDPILPPPRVGSHTKNRPAISSPFHLCKPLALQCNAPLTRYARDFASASLSSRERRLQKKKIGSISTASLPPLCFHPPILFLSTSLTLLPARELASKRTGKPAGWLWSVPLNSQQCIVRVYCFIQLRILKGLLQWRCFVDNSTREGGTRMLVSPDRIGL